MPVVELLPGRVDVLDELPRLIIDHRFVLGVGNHARGVLLDSAISVSDRLGLVRRLLLDGAGADGIGDDRQERRDSDGDPEPVLDRLLEEVFELVHGRGSPRVQLDSWIRKVCEFRSLGRDRRRRCGCRARRRPGAAGAAVLLWPVSTSREAAFDSASRSASLMTTSVLFFWASLICLVTSATLAVSSSGLSRSSGFGGCQTNWIRKSVRVSY